MQSAGRREGAGGFAAPRGLSPPGTCPPPVTMGLLWGTPPWRWAAFRVFWGGRNVAGARRVALKRHGKVGQAEGQRLRALPWGWDRCCSPRRCSAAPCALAEQTRGCSGAFWVLPAPHDALPHPAWGWGRGRSRAHPWRAQSSRESRQRSATPSGTSPEHSVIVQRAEERGTFLFL